MILNDLLYLLLHSQMGKYSSVTNERGKYFFLHSHTTQIITFFDTVIKFNILDRNNMNVLALHYSNSVHIGMLVYAGFMHSSTKCPLF